MFWAFEKVIFQFFFKILIEEVGNIFWEGEAKCPKVFKSKVGHRKLLKKWFQKYLQLKTESSERLKRALFSCLKIFE